MSAESGSAADERSSLAHTAALLGRLLLVELDRPTLEALAEPVVAAALADLGVRVPPASDAAALDALAAAFYDAVLQPSAGGPPVQSLWTRGAYEGEPAAAVRRLAERAGFELDAEAARAAPPDHLGAILLLWAETSRDRPDVAARLARDHLQWAQPALRRLGATDGFYAEVARAVVAWIDCIAGDDAAFLGPAAS